MLFTIFTSRPLAAALALFLGGLTFPVFLSAQVALTGTVMNTEEEPLVGANVYLPELDRGAVTDEDGRFQLTIPRENTKLEVSYVGYLTYFTRISGSEPPSELRIVLKENAVSTGTILVSATRADERTPMTYSTVDREELEANNLGQDVPFLLRWTPSTVVTSDAGTGIGYTGIWIRGSDPTRTNVTINGIPLNDAESQGVFWVDLPDFASSTEDVQIQRGVGASTNGAGAFGATINLNTSKVYAEPYASVTAGLGSFNSQRGTVQFGTGKIKDRFTVDGRLSRITSDGYIDRGSADLTSWYLSGAWLGEATTLRFNAFSGHEITYQAWNGVPAAFVDDPDLRTFNSAGTEKEGEPYDNEVDDYTQTHFQLLFNHQFNTRWYLNLAGHYTIGEGFFEQYKADQDLATYGLPYPTFGDSTLTTTDLIRRRWLDNDFYGATYSLHYRAPDERLRATLGGAYSIYEGKHFGEVIWARYAGPGEIRDRYYDNDATKRDANIFAKVNYSVLPRVDAYLDLQLRGIGYDFLGVDNEGAPLDQSVNLTFFNPKAGLSWLPSKRARAYASFAVAQREPNRNDYVGSAPSRRPRPEKLYNTEAGYEYRWNKSALSANVYYMYYRDQLVINGQINDVGELLRINVDRSYRLGIELVGGAEVFPGFRLEGNATFSRNKVIRFTEYIDEYDENFNWVGQQPVKREETDLAFSPAVLGGAQLSYDWLRNSARHDLTTTLLNKYVGRRFIDNSSDEANALDPYFFSDFRVNYAWRPGWLREIRFTLLLRNVWDNLYESNGWSYRYLLEGQNQLDQGLYPQAGRNVLLSLGLDF